MLMKIVLPYNEGSRSKHERQGWRDGSEAKTTHCSSRKPELKSQEPQWNSQKFVTLGPGQPTPSSGLCGTSWTCLTCMHSGMTS